MAMKPTDPIIGRSRGQATTAKNYYTKANNRDFLADYIDAVYSLCQEDNMPDAAVVIAQADLETGGFTSYWWTERGNPAGLGITGDENQNNASRYFETGIESAKAQIAHLVLYATGKVNRGGLIPADDPRYDAYMDAYGAKIMATTLAGLENTWAHGPNARNYGGKVSSRGNSCFPNLPDAGATPLPTTPPPITNPTVETWQTIFTRIFGSGWRVTFDFKATGGRDLYKYGIGHGTDGSQHPGIDVGVPYNTSIRAPFAGKIVCAGTGVGSGAPGGSCSAYNDWGDSDQVKQGVGRIELYYPEINASLIFGHSRQSFVQPGEQVDKDERIGTTGGMHGPHCHLEAIQWGTSQGYTIVDPRSILDKLARQQQQPGTSTTPPPIIVVPRETPQTISYTGLPFSVGVQYIPSHMPQRPGGRQKPKWITVHETANPRRGAGARMHANWVGSPDSTVSVHFFVDDKEAFQTVPLNEPSYNAGCGQCEGNYAAISIETCVNEDADLAKARDNVARLVAHLMKSLGLPLSSLKKHQDWSGKWCPAIMLSGGLWPSFVQRVAAYYGSTSGSPEVPSTGYAQIYPVEVNGELWKGERDVTVGSTIFYANPRTVTVPISGYVRQFAGVESPEVGAPYYGGETAKVFGWVNGEDVDGERRWWIRDDYARFWVGLTDEKPSEVGIPSEEVPGDGDGSDSPDIPDVPEIKFINGIRFYPVGMPGDTRTVMLKEDAASRQWASDEAEIRQQFSKGDTTDVTYWVRGKDIDGENLYWVLAEDDSRLWIGHTYEWPM